MNFIKDLLSNEELQKYTMTEYPFNLSILYSALKQKLKMDPNYEVFVPLVYCQCALYFKNKLLARKLLPYKYFISNRGVVISLRNKTPLLSTISINKGGYFVFSFPTKNKPGVRWFKCVLHRALASSFLPLEEGFGPFNFKDLLVNHIDGVKTNPVLNNLEWCTAKQNSDHALKTGLSKIFTAENHHRSKAVKGIILEGKFKGLEFILIGKKEHQLYGFSDTNVNGCCRGIIKKYKNCKFVFASKSEAKTLQRGLSKEIMATIPKTLWPVKSSILAINISSGEKFVIHGGKPELLKRGFNPARVSDVINGHRRKHKNHIFERI